VSEQNDHRSFGSLRRKHATAGRTSGFACRDFGFGEKKSDASEVAVITMYSSLMETMCPRQFPA
jgi:hypothetical protein